MLEVRADVGKNRLQICHLGPLDEADVERIAEAVLREMERLWKGFDVVVDLRQAGLLGPAAVRQLHRLMEAAAARGAGRHVMLVGRSVETTLQFQRLSKALGNEGFLAFSWEEVERFLESRR